jgi:hypothetical protein
MGRTVLPPPYRLYTRVQFLNLFSLVGGLRAIGEVGRGGIGEIGPSYLSYPF